MSETKAGSPKEKKVKKKGRFLKKLKKWIKRLIILIVLIVLALFGLKAYIQHQAANQEEEEGYSQAIVLSGAMEETVYGTGTTSARNQPNILAEADGTLTDLRVSVGDAVREGDILAVLTNEELDDTITDLEFALWDLDDTITGTQAGARVTSIEAPVAGRVMAIYAEAGDDALAVFRREGALAIISTDGRMKVELRGENSTLGLALDQKVTVRGEGFEAEGTVVDLTRQGTQATITINDDQLPMGAPVSVLTAEGELLGEAELEVNKPMAVSSFGGTIKKVLVEVGKEVKRRDMLFTLEDSPLTLTVEDLRLQREAAAKELEDAKAQREALIVLAPCDGVVASLEVGEGDEITAGTLLGSILHGEDMNLTIAVDELDVVEVEVGQKVTITVDAFGDAEYEGEVYKIAPVGTNSGGVTTYDVELTFEAAGTGVRSGMNATGEIQVASAEETLYVPVEALMTVGDETYVMVADGGGSNLAAAFSQMRASRSQSADDAQQGGFSQRPEGMTMPEGMTLPEGMGRNGSRQQSADGESAEGESEEAIKEPSVGLLERFRAWLYEGVDTTGAEQMTGTLVKVEVGMQNDDYAEILSGVSEGDVVLYTGSSEDSSSFSFGSMGGGRSGMGGMGGMSIPMGGF